MSAKVLINGVAGVGKSSLVKPLRNAFVVSRDGKAFPFAIPHMTIPTFHNMSTVILGGTVKTEDGEEYIEGVEDKLERYHEKFGSYPETIVIDSVSKLIQDVIDYANLNFTNFDIHSTINKEVAILTSFIQETLVANGINVVLINHVMDNDKKGYVPIGQGKFKDKGGFYSEVDHSIFVGLEGKNVTVTHRGTDKQARTLIDELPDKQYVENILDPAKSKKLKEDEEYYNLQAHLDLINEKRAETDEWKL